MLAAALFAVPATATAQRALWLSEDAGSPELRAAVAASTGLELVDEASLHAELEARASTLGPDPAEEAMAAALREAHRAYVELRLGEAAAAYQTALEAALGSMRHPPQPDVVGRILFERSLVHLAAHRRRDAERDLRAALIMSPSLSPDPNVYGAPLLELVGRARRARARTRRIVVGEAPAGVRVRVDGNPAEGAVDVRGDGPHLVTAEGLGVQARAWLVRTPTRERTVAVELVPAGPPLLAAQLLELGDEAPRRLVLEALGVDRVIRVNGLGEELDVTLAEPSGEVLARSVGTRVQGEPSPYFVLAERLAGREVDVTPGSEASPAALAVSAPQTVHPRDVIPFRVTLSDPDGQARSLRASCGGAPIAHEAVPETTLTLLAPEEPGRLPCAVMALGEDGEALVRRVLSVEVVAVPGDDTGWWVLGGATGAAVVTAIAILAAVLYEPPQRLVIGGLP